MKEWRTAKELAAEKLPHFPQTEQAAKRFAEREGWNTHPAWCRNRQGRGGGLEYHINLLPTLARLDYERRHRKITAPEPVATPEPTLGLNLTARATRERDARLAIVAAFEKFCQGQRLSLSACEEIYVNGYNMGRQPVDAWIKDMIPHLAKRSLARWRSVKVKGQLEALAHDPALNRKGKSLIETAENGSAKHVVLSLIAHQPHIKAERVMTLLSEKFGGGLTDNAGKKHPIPPVRTIQHWMKIWRVQEAVALAQMSDPDRYRSTMAPAGVGTLRHIRNANLLWMIDASPLDAMDETVARPTVYACVDIGTRRMVLSISRTPRASAVALLLRKAILAWGVPETIKTDNGSDFVAEDTQRLLASLNIKLDLSDAYAPQQKGHVERAIKTMQHGLAELLPGYVGHNVTERKRLEDRLSFAKRLGAETAELFGVRYTLAEIQKVADRWIETVYEQSAHEGLNGRTPATASRESTSVIRTVDVRALDMLLMPVAKGGGYRKVTKLGVRVGDYHYATIKAFPGDDVMVRLDPADLGIVYLFDRKSGDYVEPALCPELAGVDPADYMKTVKERRAALLRERTDPIKAELKALTTGRPMIERYLDEKERQRTKPDNVVALPQRTVEHNTPEIAAALMAATGEMRQPSSDLALPVPAEDAAILPFPVKPASTDGRPAFRTDQEMAAWLIAHPAELTDQDRRLMGERLKSWTFKELLSVHGVEVDALTQLIKSPQQQVRL